MRRALDGLCTAVWALIAIGCGTGGAPAPSDAGDGDAGPRVESDEPLAQIPSMPISQLLGKRRADIETLFHPAEQGHSAEWVRYNEHLEVRYEKDRCVELIQLVPGGKTCRAAARWVGFGDAMAPIYRAGRCVWPPDSLKHSLGRDLSGELVYKGGVFRARLHR